MCTSTMYIVLNITTVHCGMASVGHVGVAGREKFARTRLENTAE